MATGNRGGRPRKPTALHLVNGNPSKIPNLEEKFAAEPKPMMVSPDALPPPPECLTQTGAEVWRENTAFLSRMKVLTVADLQLLEMYCVAYEGYRGCWKMIRDANTQFYKPYAGSNCVQELPHGGTMRSYMKVMIEISREFGMTPAARGRMTLPEDKEAEDEMERLLRGG